MANVEGSIYRNENGVAVPYANLNLGGGTSISRNIVPVADRYTPNSDLGTLDACNVMATICGNITMINFYIQPSAASLTLGSSGYINTIQLLQYTTAVGDELDSLLQPYKQSGMTGRVSLPIFAYVAGGEQKAFKGAYDWFTAGGILRIELGGQQTFLFDTYNGFVAEAIFVNNATLGG